MKFRLLAVFAALLVLCVAADTYAQGRGSGRGGGGGNGSGNGNGSGAGRSMGGSGVDRGLGNASSRSDGRSDNGLGNASTKSNGRSANGLDRARLARENANKMSDNELNRYRGLSKKLGTTPEEMRARYQAALLQNPDLNYGNFVAAHVIADNLNGRYPNVTSSAILAGLASGDSIGETLRNLRLTKEQAKIVQRDADDKIRAARNRRIQ